MAHLINECKNDDPKGHEIYITILRGMTPAQKLNKVFELNKLGKALLKAGIDQQFKNLDENQKKEIFLNRIRQCHNLNY